MNDKSQRSRWGIFIKFSAFTLWWHLWDRFASSRIDLKSTLVENPVLAREKSTRARGLWDRDDIKSMRRYFREWSRVNRWLFLNNLRHMHTYTQKFELPYAIFDDNDIEYEATRSFFVATDLYGRFMQLVLLAIESCGTCRTNIFPLPLSLSLSLSRERKCEIIKRATVAIE